MFNRLRNQALFRLICENSMEPNQSGARYTTQPIQKLLLATPFPSAPWLRGTYIELLFS